MLLIKTRGGRETDREEIIRGTELFLFFFFSNRVYLFCHFFIYFNNSTLGAIWSGFCAIYPGLDPVSHDKEAECPSCVLIPLMNIQPLGSAPPFPLFSHLRWYLRAEGTLIMALEGDEAKGSGVDIQYDMPPIRGHASVDSK